MDEAIRTNAQGRRAQARHGRRPLQSWRRPGGSRAHGEASEEFSSAVKFKPDSRPGPRVPRPRAAGRGKFAEAAGHFEAAVRARPITRRRLTTSARALAACGRVDEAIVSRRSAWPSPSASGSHGWRKGSGAVPRPLQRPRLPEGRRVAANQAFPRHRAGRGRGTRARRRRVAGNQAFPRHRARRGRGTRGAGGAGSWQSGVPPAQGRAGTRDAWRGGRVAGNQAFPRHRAGRGRGAARVLAANQAFPRHRAGRGRGTRGAAPCSCQSGVPPAQGRAGTSGRGRGARQLPIRRSPGTGPAGTRSSAASTGLRTSVALLVAG